MKNSFLKNVTWIWILLFPILFLIGAFYYYRSEDKWFENVIEINAKDSLNIKVNSCWVNEGVIHFNDTWYISAKNFNSKVSHNKYIWEIQTPFNLIKKLDNDTIKVLTKNKVRFVVFDNSKSNKDYKRDLTFKEFFKKLIK
jgi:hypothetical protein